MSDKPQLPKPQVTPRPGKKASKPESEKYHKVVLSHPVEAITVTEQERRKRKVEPKQVEQEITWEEASLDWKARIEKMVKKEW